MRYPYEKITQAMRYWLAGRGYYDTLAAMNEAMRYHDGMRKDGRTPEFEHQLAQAHYARTLESLLTYPEETLRTIFLHDTPEDYDMELSHVEDRYGKRTRSGTWSMTKIFKGKKKTPEEYYGELAEDEVGSICKGLDRHHNLLTMIGVFDTEKQHRYIKETRDYIIPMLEKARVKFPKQEPVYNDVIKLLKVQIDLTELILDTEEHPNHPMASRKEMFELNMPLPLPAMEEELKALTPKTDVLTAADEIKWQTKAAIVQEKLRDLRMDEPQHEQACEYYKNAIRLRVYLLEHAQQRRLSLNTSPTPKRQKHPTVGKSLTP